MPDVHDRDTRRRNMAAIRRRNTKPELLLRRGLHAQGFRYRLDVGGMPGRPDIVLPKYGAVVFVNGCFWHGHGCSLFKWPKTRTEFWRDKIGGNVERDASTERALLERGWRVGKVWECAMKGRKRRDLDEVVGIVSEWLRGEETALEVAEQN